MENAISLDTYNQNIKLEHPIKYFSLSKKDYFFEGHSHDHWEVKYIHRGVLNVTYNNLVLDIKAGDIMIFEPDAFHCERTEDADYDVFHFYAEGISIGGVPRVISLNESEKMLCELCCSFARDEVYDKTGTLDKERCDKTITKLLEVLVYRVLSSENIDNSFATSKKALLYSKATCFMLENLHRKLSVEEIANHCETSVTALKDIFKKYTGRGIIHHHLMMRTEKAKQLLKENKPYGDIAKALGFSSQSYFSQCFLRIYGHPPSHFKNKS